MLELCRGAERKVLLVAPFVKVRALQRVLSAIGKEIKDITCVGRLRPEDVVGGATDLAVFDVIAKQPGARLLYHPYLHAKLYRADDRCLVGSANITYRGLGWTTPANLETLVSVSAADPAIVELEARLVAESMPADEAFRVALTLEVDRLRETGALAAEVDGGEEPSEQWLPLCSRPDQLWNVYAGVRLGDVLASNVEAATRDIDALRIPKGLPKNQFLACVSLAVRRVPLVETLRSRGSGACDREGLDLVREQCASAEGQSSLEPEDLWENLKEWLLMFLSRDFHAAVREELSIGRSRIVR